MGALMATGAPRFVLTLDIDWAPDFMIEAALATLRRHRLPATLFITHDSPLLSALGARPGPFELGVHPNFLPGSSHGDTPRQVLACVRRLLPDARSMRTHALHQSSPLLALASAEFGLRTDASLLLPGARHLAPHAVHYDHDATPLVRVPSCFEDDEHACRPGTAWRLSELRLRTPGLKVMTFHPVLIYLNSANLRGYRALKQLGPLPSLTRDHAEPLINRTGRGVGTLFEDVCHFLAARPGDTGCVDAVAEHYRATAA
jgi:hypothetical protein